MSLIDCINVVDTVEYQRCYFPMLFTIHHHHSLFRLKCCPSHLDMCGIGALPHNLKTPCFLLPVKTLCLLVTFWLLT